MILGERWRVTMAGGVEDFVLGLNSEADGKYLKMEALNFLLGTR
jgi:hypothetical protein